MLITTPTQLKIINAFFELADEKPEATISLQMIADKVGISRGSITRYHFKNIPGLLNHIHGLIDNEIREQFERMVHSSDSWSDLLIFFNQEMIPYLFSRKHWLKPLYNTYQDPKWLAYLEHEYAPIIEMYLWKVGKKDIIPNEFLAKFVVKQFLSIVSIWLSDEEAEKPEDFQEKFIHALDISISDILKAN